MTQEEKELLLQDLCARLPYGVKAHYDMSADPCWDDEPVGDDNLRGFSCGYFELDCAVGISVENIKPYLRPISSMTEEEKKEYNSFSLGEDKVSNLYMSVPAFHVLDWLNAHHFDYRGLIPKGYALEAPENMYNIKTD